MNSVLIVVAHPDDEILGCGGTAAALAEAGVRVQACVLCGLAEARGGRPEISLLHEHCRAASRTVGMHAPILGVFPNLGLGAVPHRELTAFIEGAIAESCASVLFTHHPADLNDDHLHVSRACQAAARLSHRKSGVRRLEGLYFMEILSSTDWSFPAGISSFAPNSFVELSPAHVRAKQDALACYEGVMRPFPHSRSVRAIDALLSVRGAQCNAPAAEAFQTAFSLLSTSAMFP